jgi:ribosomal protein S18 acetylase RimI-like enzyme
LTPPTVRPAAPADADTLIDFNLRMARETEGLSLDPPTLGRGVRAALSDPAKALYFVADLGGKVVGQLMLTLEWSDWRDGDIWWIQSVYVHPDHRRRGVFRALYEHARRRARAAGVVSLRLYVERHNAAAQDVYRSLGMTDAGYLVMEEMFVTLAPSAPLTARPSEGAPAPQPPPPHGRSGRPGPP